MRKVKFFASLTALMTLSVAALTACTTAEASTHHTAPRLAVRASIPPVLTQS